MPQLVNEYPGLRLYKNPGRENATGNRTASVINLGGESNMKALN